jgi:cytochrome c6
MAILCFGKTAMLRIAALSLVISTVATPAFSQTATQDNAAAKAPRSAAGSDAALFQQGVEQYKRTCQQCHGRNMVNAGTTVYDLRRFPQDDRERFFNSVTNGKGNMPSFKDALSVDQITALWTYVRNRGKAPE